MLLSLRVKFPKIDCAKEGKYAVDTTTTDKIVSKIIAAKENWVQKVSRCFVGNC